MLQTYCACVGTINATCADVGSRDSCVVAVFGFNVVSALVFRHNLNGSHTSDAAVVVSCKCDQYV